MTSKSFPEIQCQTLLTGSTVADSNGSTGQPQPLNKEPRIGESSERGSLSGRATPRRLATEERILQEHHGRSQVQGRASDSSPEMPLLRRDAGDRDDQRSYVEQPPRSLIDHGPQVGAPP